MHTATIFKYSRLIEVEVFIEVDADTIGAHGVEGGIFLLPESEKWL